MSGIEHEHAKRLVQLAERIEEAGGIPCYREGLKELPGVGDYIASEVLLEACRKPEPLLDRNMIRVLERVFGISSERRRPHTDPKMWSFARSLVPEDPEEAIAFNYGIMDLARKVCRPRNPKCGSCPLRDICLYNLSHNRPQAQLPPF